jgi:hypothetical protein
VNRNPLFWTSASQRPSLHLQASELIWTQHDVVVEPAELTALFDQMCDLAQLIEEMQCAVSTT